jgi:RHS repeat-associated protein
MNQQGQLISYRYDALDRLMGVEPFAASSTTRMYRDGRLATQLEGGQQHSLFEAGDHLLAQSTHSGNRTVNTLLGCDQQRSVVQSVSGNRVQHSAYTPYGGQPAEGGVHSLLGFNGEQPDPVTGCYLLGNGYRAYNPQLMRFHSPDSMSPFDSGGINPYAYCLGDPVNMSDPTGHFSWKSILSIVISVAAIALTVVTLGAGAPLTGPLLAVAAIGIVGETLSIASVLATELAPHSEAGAVLGQFSLALSVASLATPAAAKFAASRSVRAASKFFKAGPVSVARQGAVRVSNGQGLKSLSGVAGLGKGARNTVAVQNRLLDAAEGFKYVKYFGYGVKGGSIGFDAFALLKAPADPAQSDGPSTLDASVRRDFGPDDQAQPITDMKIGEVLTQGQNRLLGMREF